ncbi:hypothetical protein P692DRAFT_20882004, partial [Suillus brevipes Sb2]
MPRPSIRKDLLNIVDQAALSVARLQYQDLLDDWSDFESDTDSDTDSDSNSLSASGDDHDNTFSLSFSSPSPLSPLSP